MNIIWMESQWIYSFTWTLYEWNHTFYCFVSCFFFTTFVKVISILGIPVLCSYLLFYWIPLHEYTAVYLSIFYCCVLLLEKEMATHSSVLAWRIPGTGEPGGLPPMGSHRVGHNWSDLAAAAVACSTIGGHIHCFKI